MTPSTFLDQAEIEVRSGKGGNGMMHFRREKFEARGGPDGGDGGRGGNIVFRVDTNLRTLYSLRNKQTLAADDGKHGGRAKRSGKSGADLVVLVPPGTLIYDVSKSDLLADLTEIDQEAIICEGGRGGRGNVHFANSRNRAPRIAEKGEPPTERSLRLELKLIADVGIVGVPNAGKSTFLAVVTNAKPKIANYPFTTLEPNLGVAALDDDTTLVLADIPGLIEGASQGLGLGHDFLRHVQRTRVLIHLLDGMAEDPIADYAQTNTELSLFDPDLANKIQILVLNKMDMPEVQAKSAALQSYFADLDIELHSLSGLTGENSRQILGLALTALEESTETAHEEVPVYKPESDPREYHVEREDEGWRLHGESIERAAAMTYWDLDQSVRRFQRILDRLGVNDLLKQEGIVAGETVFIGEYALEWEE
jgi:GTP-binding protein